MSNKNISISVILLTLLMAFMEISGLPASLFVTIEVVDIDPTYFTLMINFVIAGMICFLWKIFINKAWRFGFQLKGLKDGLKKYGLPALVATILVSAAFCIGLFPFDNSPTVYRVIIEGFVYYIGVAIIEEIYLRGLLQNLLEKWFGKQKNAALYAILVASVLFGMGHIFGAAGQPIITVICKVFWATALGIYLGAVYYRTRNIWVPIVLHMVIDFCGVPFCFSTSNQYPEIALFACVIVYGLLGCYGILIVTKKDEAKVA